ncbi:hypothetical protein CH379_019540 [Leptospira ellisii]|uniref:Uncharacterized protein n=1 Tax=Leptospira ellisii TaxID=2023197 RepID=A0A2N0BI26_9LEPT|nr:hypothetical protein [Leptospira ellisii]MDV6237825.1 hypothetical protein [Leptospira ellisii]PJZ92581.1 hypothetical protein CH379_12315 [Leptospira ellisii]PKA03663.1 hypothetical protein CH375_15660 [Leptospira ellisii]
MEEDKLTNYNKRLSEVKDKIIKVVAALESLENNFIASDKYFSAIREEIYNVGTEMLNAAYLLSDLMTDLEE